MNDDLTHRSHMLTALRLARRNLGQTWPNPAVGALVVKDGKVVGRGWTAPGGRPHAEPQALAQAGEQTKGATLYVTLEPCAHHGQTPPCAEAIAAAGISHAVVACRDPNPKVNGAGLGMLQVAGIKVTEGVCEAEAQALNAGFFSVITRGKPFVALKIATSLDGRIAHAQPCPDNRWLTGPETRAYAHLLRAEHDAILTGIGTVLADDPQLTCRLPGLEHRSPQRIVLDRQNRLPPTAQLAQGQALWVERDTDDLPALLARLAERGITRLLVEAGQRVTGAFLQAGLVDRLYWFRAPLIIGEGLAAVDVPSPGSWHCTERKTLGADTLDIFDKEALCLPA